MQHALKVMAALASNNYVAFFRLMEVTPNDGNRILGRMETKQRVAALRVMVKAYKQNPLPISFVRDQLFRADADATPKFVADFCRVLGLVVEDCAAEGGGAAENDDDEDGGGGAGAGGAAINTKKSAGKTLRIENVDTWLGVARGTLL